MGDLRKESKFKKKDQINKRLNFQNPNRDHIFVCFLPVCDKTKRLDYIMRRHHMMFDYQRLECDMEKAMEHQMEYADLMEWVTKTSMRKLVAKGYNESRGDSTGVMVTSSRRPLLVFSVGMLKKKITEEKNK